MLAITILIALTGLIIASITDIKTREVPDWLSYAMIASGIAINSIYSLVYSDSSYILHSFLGFLCLGIIAFVMFKTGQWGGGDSKILVSIGALIGLELNINNFLLAFFLNVMLIGALYGLIWGAVVSIRHKEIFLEKLKIIVSQKKVKIARLYVPFLSIIPFLFFALRPSFASFLISLCLSLMINLMLWTYIFSKAFEDAFMYKFVNPQKLTEGDWIADELKINGKYVCGPKDLGISEAQIKKLIKLDIKKIRIKEGIPFIPPFLISFIITFLTGNIFLMMLILS